MKARKFADEEIRPITLERDRIADPFQTWDWEVIKKGSRLGFRIAAVPKEWGGPGLDFVTQALIMEELAKADSSVSKAFSQNWKWTLLICSSCTEDQKARFLKPFLADDTYLLGSGSTEPNSGSDNRYPPDDPRAGYRTRAERRGNEWILNGEKCFIAQGSVGSLFFISARTNFNVPAREGSTVFLVPKGTPGFRIGKVFNKAGWRFYQNAELIFEDARVPHANMVGEVNGSAKVRGGAAAEFGDIELACNALGVCEDACDSAMRFARTCQQGGKKLIDQQAIQLKIISMNTLTEALRSFVMRAAWELDQKIHGAPNSVLLMNYSTDVIQRVTQLNMDVHATGGFAMDHHADKLVRDAIIWTHLAGDNTQRLKVMKRFPK
jgi:alkylation response protein AidB-like acyl-CoA dehydrogenase